MNNERVITIAIDGPVGAGKSYAAKNTAKRLGIAYLDTGAMYRAVGLYMMRNGIDMTDEAAVSASMSKVDITVDYVGEAQHTYLNGEDVTLLIRTSDISSAASCVGAIAYVRELMVERQREIAKGRSLVMDGRDIGTIVLTDATLKIFLTAAPEIRAMRRYNEIKDKRDVTYEQVLSELYERDENDTTRLASPLRMADDAVELDSSDLNEVQVVDKIVDLLNTKLEGNVL